jgi:hypothetical protein
MNRGGFLECLIFDASQSILDSILDTPLVIYSLGEGFFPILPII